MVVGKSAGLLNGEKGGDGVLEVEMGVVQELLREGLGSVGDSDELGNQFGGDVHFGRGWREGG